MPTSAPPDKLGRVQQTQSTPKKEASSPSTSFERGAPRLWDPCSMLSAHTLRCVRGPRPRNQRSIVYRNEKSMLQCAASQGTASICISSHTSMPRNVLAAVLDVGTRPYVVT
jgi:hypothetical protein